MNEVGDDADAATRDVLDQVALVEAGLRELGLAGARLAVPPGGPWRREWLAGAGVVVNLVESPPGDPWVQVRFARLLEEAGVPFSGSSAHAIALTTDKAATRERLVEAGIPVADGGVIAPHDDSVLVRVPPPWVLKPACEDASVGLEDAPVCTTPEAARARAAALAVRFGGQPILVEQYLPGREFNVSLLEDAQGPEALPVAEIEFRDFPPDQPRLLDWASKWEPDSPGYRRTVRVYPEDVADRPLVAELAALALRSWAVCGCRGYARVDIRLDHLGQPRVLEVNANPCLSADAGFMVAASRAGLTPGSVVERLLTAAGRRVEVHP